MDTRRCFFLSYMSVHVLGVTNLPKKKRIKELKVELAAESKPPSCTEKPAARVGDHYYQKSTIG